MHQQQIQLYQINIMKIQSQLTIIIPQKNLKILIPIILNSPIKRTVVGQHGYKMQHLILV